MRSHSLTLFLVGSIALSGALGQPAAAAPSEQVGPGPTWEWLGPQGEPLPWTDEEEALAFLSTAKVVAEKVISTGINRTLKVRLEDDRGLTAHAAFRTVDLQREGVQIAGRFYRDFRDSHLFECAAYRLSRQLGIDNVPPCVRRTLRGKAGTLQLWVENAMSEQDRRERALHPPDALAWARQRQLRRLFDALIYNIDRNQGNMLIGPDWKLWFIDHTRSFLLVKRIQTPTSGGPIIWCERGVWEKLQALEKARLKEDLKGLVSPRQIAYLLIRRDLLLDHLRQLIATKGEGGVLFDWSQDQQELGDDLEALQDEDIPASAEDPGEDPSA